MVSVALTPLPRVIPTARRAESAISTKFPAVKVTIVLPLNRELVPTANALEIVALGILVPLILTAKVTVVASAAVKVVE